MKRRSGRFFWFQPAGCCASWPLIAIAIAEDRFSQRWASASDIAASASGGSEDQQRVESAITRMLLQRSLTTKEHKNLTG
jgi:hypothetical protein